MRFILPSVHVLFTFLFLLLSGLGDWPTHIAHLRHGTIVAFHDFYNSFPDLDSTITKQLESLLALRGNDGSQSFKPTPLNFANLRRNMDSPLFKVVEQWLRKDLAEVQQLRAEERRKNNEEQDKILLGEEEPRTR